MDICWPDDTRQVTLDWSKPITEAGLRDLPQDFIKSAWFYAVLGDLSGGSKLDVLYISKLTHASITFRPRQIGLPTTQRRYPKTELVVTGATVGERNFGRLTPRILDDIETLLIYANWSEDMVNRSKVYSGGSKRELLINNLGHKCMPERIFWGAVRG